LSQLDIPEGTKIGEIMKGGEDTLQQIMNLLTEKPINGYVKVKLGREGTDITSYMIIKDSEPLFGLREIVTSDKKYPKRRVRKVYAGENTLLDVKVDTHDENATIELYSDVDIEPIIKRYGIDEKVKNKGQPSKTDARRVGLFWGGKEEEENLERQVLGDKLKNWKQEGYDVSKLEEIFPGDLKEVKAAFDRFEEKVTTLEEMAAELEFFSLAGFEKEIEDLKAKLKDPGQIPSIREEIEVLEKKASKKKDGSKKKICLVCGFPIGDEKKCPRCGAVAEKKVIDVEEEKEEGIEIMSGHCYLIEEEKPKRTLKLFNEMLGKGYKGLFITRTNPKRLKDMKKLENTSIIWLTDKESVKETTIPPILERIIYELGDYLKIEEKGCLILDGIEYLVSNNSFDAVLRFIRRIVDEVSETKSVFMVTVGPSTLKERELKILEREMEII
jgi:rubrerythrin